MSKGHTNVTKLAVVLLPLLGSIAASAQLAPDSPFLTQVAGSVRTSTSDGKTLELRGIMSGPEGNSYCIYDPLKGKSSWVEVREPGLPFEVLSADPDQETVTLRTSNGRQLVLALREAKIGSQASKPYVAPVGPDFTKVTPELVAQQQQMDQQREIMAQKRAEHLRAVRAGVVPQAPSAPAAPPPEL